MTAEIKVSVVADTKDLQVNVGDAATSLEGLESAAADSAGGVESALSGIAESSGNVASTSKKTGAALAGLGGVVATQLGFPEVGEAMQVAGTAMKSVGNAGKLLNVVTQSTIFQNVALKASTIATSIAQKAAAASQWALNVAMSANPIGLVVVALVALVAVVVLAMKHSDRFRAIVTGAFDAVWHAAEKAFGWVKAHWPLLLAIITGPIGLAVLAIVKNWDKIRNGATAAVDWVRDKFGDLVGYVRGLPGRIGKAASGMFDGVKDAFKSSINWIVDKWNGLEFSIPSVDTHIPGVGKVGGFSLGTPNIPRLATGGRAERGSLVVIGDGREPESVLPDSMMERALARAAAAGSGSTTINIVAHDYADFERQMGRKSAMAGIGGRPW